MARTITVAAAQTGPVVTRDMSAGVARASELVEQAAAQGAEIICFSELFLTPFFPNRLVPDYESFFLELPSPVTDPLFARARERRIAMILP
jgi:predicted amidohydrolase